jgi:hypothetical protein
MDGSSARAYLTLLFTVAMLAVLESPNHAARGYIGTV